MPIFVADNYAVLSKSFSKAAVSVIYNTKTNTRPRTVYAQTAVGRACQNFVPDPPTAAYEKSDFVCPYCRMTLDAVEMRNR